MVQNYTEAFYLLAHEASQRLAAEDAAGAKALAAWKARVRQSWPEVRVESVENHAPSTLPVGQPIQARVRVHLGALTPDDVAVELYHGSVNADGQLVNAVATFMQPAGPVEGGSYLFEAKPVTCRDSGLHGFTVRVLPYHPDLPTALMPGLICWA
jgi:starch phosphorylase